MASVLPPAASVSPVPPITPNQSRTVIWGLIHCLLLIASAYMAAREKAQVDVPTPPIPVFAADGSAAPPSNFTTVTIDCPIPKWGVVFMVLAFAAFPLYFYLRLITYRPMRWWSFSVS